MKKQFSVKHDKTRNYRCKNKLNDRFVLYDDLYELRGLLQITIKQIDIFLGINEIENKEIYKSNFNLK